MLRAVTFDLWGTLMMDRPEGMRRVKAEKVRRIGEVLCNDSIIRDPEAIRRAYDLAGERLATLWATHRDVGTRLQVELILEILQIEEASRPALMDGLVDAYTTPILSELPVRIDGAAGVLAALETRGLRLAVICNTGRTPGTTLRVILERLGLAKHLLVQTFSDELGLRKPRAEIFRQTLSALGVQPAEALHVGDTLASDIVGAHAIGMRAIHFCHSGGADPTPGDTETICSLTELLPLIG